MFVIGTAGHVDHGKSTLIQALTGIDPDRLREEKERGLTIDLGFAWMNLPSGREVSIVDVPGHERFVKNMLAGVGGIDLALLVVAADEAVMPQTREHLAILDLLEIKRGIVALTKKDLVEQDWLDLVNAEVEETLQGTTLTGAQVFAVSAYTGEGLCELVAAIDALLDESETRRDIGRPRLPVDRSFVIPGFGTVVTGTLADGTLRIGQEVELVLAQRRVRVRGLQTHRKSEEEAQPGTRTAVNLAGISHEEIDRGEVLTIPDWLRPTSAVDVRLRLIPDAPRRLRHNASVTFHSGTGETLARTRHLDRTELAPGDTGWAQIKLQDPAPLVKGDFFVIRWADATVGGGTVVDPHAKRHRRFHAPTLEHLEVLEQGTTEDIVLEALDSVGTADVQQISRQANLSVPDTREQLAALLRSGVVVALGASAVQDNTVFVSEPAWRQIKERARLVLEGYHEQHPLRRGAPREELRSRLRLESHASVVALQRLVEEGIIVEEDPWIRLPQHRVKVAHEERKRLEEYLRRLKAEPFSPPTSNMPAPDLINLLVDEGEVVKVSESVVFEASAYEEMMSKVIEHLRSEGKITVAQVRDLFGTSRKYALALMEHLDQRRVTRRVGDERVLR